MTSRSEDPTHLSCDLQVLASGDHKGADPRRVGADLAIAVTGTVERRIDVHTEEGEAIRRPLPHLRRVLADAPREHECVEPVHRGRHGRHRPPESVQVDGKREASTGVPRPGPAQDLAHVVRSRQPAEPRPMLQGCRKLGRRSADVLFQPQHEPGIDAARSGRHHETLERREAHRARRAQEEALAAASRIGLEPLQALAQIQLALLDLMQGALDQTRRRLAAAAATLERIHYLEGTGYALEAAAGLAVAERRMETASAALRAGDEIRERLQMPIWPPLQPLHDSLVAACSGHQPSDLGSDPWLVLRQTLASEPWTELESSNEDPEQLQTDRGPGATSADTIESWPNELSEERRQGVRIPSRRDYGRQDCASLFPILTASKRGDWRRSLPADPARTSGA
jgi:hypothetical protein